jgi:zinc transporter
MSESDGLICAYELNEDGSGTLTEAWDKLPSLQGEKPSWIHLDRGGDRTSTWLHTESKLRPIIQEALLAEESRPRCTSYDEGVFLNLRGLNLNPRAEPEDMLSVRIWIEPARIITTCLHPLMAVQDVRDALDQSNGPKDIGAFVIMLANRLTARIDPLLDELQDRLDGLEDTVVANVRRELRSELARLRRRTILLRRYIGPQREALRALATLDVEWLTDRQRDRINEIADRVTRYVEDLDVIRDRASILQDELTSLLTERMDRTMYVLSIVAVIFLPLTLVSGMLGMNVGGIPGEKNPWAFTILSVAFVLIVALEVWLVRKLKWWV